MKEVKKKAILFFMFISILTIGITYYAEAKFWGWETRSTTDWADGECTYRETCKVHYIFWIGGEEQCSTETLRCL